MQRSEFVKHLRHSQLLTEEQFARFTGRFPGDDQARALAHALVDEGVLTRFQARKIKEGKSGWLVLGQYRILDRLGRGGTAHVFKAIHTAMERVVALKIILPSLLKEPQALDLFRREVRAAAQLHHPNIVAAFDAGQSRALHYLVLEYVEGTNLHNLVRQRGPLPVGLACEVIRQTARALQYAFQMGLVHRDIKPANLILCHAHGAAELPTPPVVKVFDFGLARLTTTAVAKAVDTIMVESGTILGTLDYISPEQANDVHNADVRSDLYSLGCTFYYALTGQAPFSGSPMEKLVRHLTGEPEPVRKLRPDVPVAVVAVVRKLMAKQREQRYQTPAEVAEALIPLCGPADSMLSRPQTVVPENVFRERRDSMLPPTSADLSHAETATVRISTAADTHTPQAATGPAPSAPPPPPDEARFRTAWRRWAGLLEFVVRGKGLAHAINREAFGALHRELTQTCAALAEVSTGRRREFFRGLECLVSPWMSPEVLGRTDPDLIIDLFERCQRAAVDIDRYTGVLQDAPAEAATGLGGFFSRFRARRQARSDFNAEMQRVFGVKL